MGKCTEGGKLLIVGNPYGICTELCQLLLYTCQVLADGHSLKLNAQSLGQLSTLGQKFKADICNLATLQLYIYKYIIHRKKLLTERVARNQFNHKSLNLGVATRKSL